MSNCLSLDSEITSDLAKCLLTLVEDYCPPLTYDSYNIGYETILVFGKDDTGLEFCIECPEVQYHRFRLNLYYFTNFSPLPRWDSQGPVMEFCVILHPENPSFISEIEKWLKRLV